MGEGIKGAEEKGSDCIQIHFFQRGSVWKGWWQIENNTRSSNREKKTKPPSCFISDHKGDEGGARKERGMKPEGGVFPSKFWGTSRDIILGQKGGARRSDAS